MRLRVVIFDDEPAIRELLRTVCERRGYEVFTFRNPGLCPLHVMERCPCGPGAFCADLLLCDLHMPEVAGLDFVEGLRAKGCAGPQIALMSGAWSPAAHARAVRLGCRLFEKPFEIPELLAWLHLAEVQVAPRRALLDWRELGWRPEPSAPGAAP
jgi:DNA-binding response OmpR family regulator